MSIFPFSRGERRAAQLTAEVITLVFIWAGAVTGIVLSKNPEDEAWKSNLHREEKKDTAGLSFDVPAIKSQTLNPKEMPFDVWEKYVMLSSSDKSNTRMESMHERSKVKSSCKNK